MSAPSCSYKKQGPCSSELTHEVKRYFTNGNSLFLCSRHALEWNALHPFGPRATIAKAEGRS